MAAGEGTLRGAGDERPRCDGVVTWPVGFFEAELGCAGLEGVGVDMVATDAMYAAGSRDVL